MMPETCLAFGINLGWWMVFFVITTCIELAIIIHITRVKI